MLMFLYSFLVLLLMFHDPVLVLLLMLMVMVQVCILLADLYLNAHGSAVSDVCFHWQNNSLVLTCGCEGKVNLLSKKQQHPVQWYMNHKVPANTIEISPEGRYFATRSDDKTWWIFSVERNREIFLPWRSSCNNYRSARFFDLTMNKEMHVAFPLDTQSVPVKRFAQCDQAALSISQVCMKIIGWETLTVF